MRMRCPYCNAEIDDASTKCSYCGSSIPPLAARSATMQNFVCNAQPSADAAIVDLDANKCGKCDTTKYSVTEAYRRMFRRFGRFAERSNRSEFWGAVLINTVVFAVLLVITLCLLLCDAEQGGVQFGFGIAFAVVMMLYAVATAFPLMCLTIRRFNDANMSPLYILMAAFPIGGFIILTTFCAFRSINDRNYDLEQAKIAAEEEKEVEADAYKL